MESSFRTGGVSFLETLTKEELLCFYKKTKDRYYNSGNPILSDDEFDILENYVRGNYEDEIFIGAGVKEKIRLPYFMGSLQKFKNKESQFHIWKKKYPSNYVISCKLDGVSGLWETDKNRLFTRGDGTFGQNISHILPFLSLPCFSERYVFRGELIMCKESDIPIRNIVSGLIHSKTVSEEQCKKLHFVPYEIVEPANISPQKQFEMLEKMFPRFLLWRAIPDFTNVFLNEILREWRDTSVYPMDGIVVRHNRIYERKDETPKYMFAYKTLLDDQTAEIIVTQIQWNVTKDGYLKPLISFDPVRIGGSSISNVTGFHAKYMTENKIGIGARLLISKSGDVIPNIEKVVIPAHGVSFPEIDFEWNDSKVEFVVKDKSLARKAQCIFFMKGLGIHGFGEKLIGRIYDTGHDTIEKMMDMSVEDLLEVEGIQKKTAEKIWHGIRTKRNSVPFCKLLALSGIMGRGCGEKKIGEILEMFPDWLDNSNIVLSKKLKHFEIFQCRLPQIREFYKKMKS